MATVHLLIKGKVQGVFYRASAKEVADNFGITGWVKNTREGNVEALACGEAASVNAFIEWCKQGPPKANVTAVIITPQNEVSFKSFEISR